MSAGYFAWLLRFGPHCECGAGTASSRLRAGAARERTNAQARRRPADGGNAADERREAGKAAAFYVRTSGVHGWLANSEQLRISTMREAVRPDAARCVGAPGSHELERAAPTGRDSAANLI
jgi:hypothetical protein